MDNLAVNDSKNVVKEEIEFSETEIQDQLLKAAFEKNTVEENVTMASKHDLTQRLNDEAKDKKNAISISCPKCLMCFGNRKLAQFHMRKIHSDTLIRPEICPICSRTFRYKSVLFVHVNNHREKVCPICNIVVPGSEALKNHAESLHIGKLEFVCPICFKLSIDSASHDDHVSSHNGRRRYECVDCLKCYASHAALERHRKTKTIKNKSRVQYKCSTCLKAYSSGRSLRVHMKTHTRTRPYKCDQCPETFLSRKALESHRKAHLILHENIKERKYTPRNQCTKDYASSQARLRIHRRNNYASSKAMQNHRQKQIDLPSKVIKKNHKCSYCLKAFANKYGLLIHINMHTGARPFECDQCPKAFASPRALRGHRVRHLPEGSSVKCTICSRTLSDSKSLRIHMNIHTDSRPYKCDQCPDSFATPWALKYHRSGHLLGASHLKCSICSKTFCSSNTLRFHMNTHSGARPYICDQCPKGFASPHSLYKHRRHHSGRGITEYKCSVCPDIFTKLRSLNLHLNSHNDGSFVCHQCGKTYASRGSLARHRRNNPSHGNYEYKCSICSKAFCFERILKNHMKTHFEPPSYKCGVCRKGFYSTSGLVQHSRIHLTDAENLHKCPVCDETFTVKQSLIDHLNTHPGSRPYKCDQCLKDYASSSALRVHLKKHLINLDRSDKNSHDEHKNGDKIEDLHTALAKYKCRECDKEFISKRNLSFHSRQHVKELKS